VTVELYKNLPTYGYNLIILRVHSGVLGREGESAPTYMFTNEEYTTSKWWLEQLTEQVLSGVVNPDNPDEKPVFTVGPAFINANSNFNKSIIILSSCLGLYTNELAETFINKGALAFISWDEKVSLSHTDEACKYLLRELIEEVTIGEAVKKVLDEVGQDPAYNSTLKHYPSEAKDLRLKF